MVKSGNWFIQKMKQKMRHVPLEADAKLNLKRCIPTLSKLGGLLSLSLKLQKSANFYSNPKANVTFHWDFKRFQHSHKRNENGIHNSQKNERKFMETTTAQMLLQMCVILLILLLWLYGHGFSAIQTRTFVNYYLMRHTRKWFIQWSIVLCFSTSNLAVNSMGFFYSFIWSLTQKVIHPTW